ncbi:MAG: D-alanyl-D-alanine carboxypeptidase/D-alanyl-D-alanine-endopeptidase [Thiotrichales bacterium]
MRTTYLKHLLPIIVAVLVVGLFAPQPLVAAPASPLDSVSGLKRSSLLVLDQHGNEKFSVRPDEFMVPASTLKIMTALLALEHWGRDFRFHTDFYIDKKKFLWIKGYGDPYLISEEITRIAARLKKAGVKRVSGIGVDGSFFAKSISIDGRDRSLSPYDAPVGAVSANFNTVFFINDPVNGVSSAEPQTPLTPVVHELVQEYSDFGEQRLNLGDPNRVPRYFAELLRAKLGAIGVTVGEPIKLGAVPKGSKRVYRHFNRHTLQEIVRGMLKASNNFIANQLFLMLGAQTYGAPANLDKSQRYAAERIRAIFDWEEFDMVEGSGLSRRNRFTARQLVTLLQYFKPYRDLMPSNQRSILAKTGTLTNVSCYAGYVESGKDWAPFALLINQPVERGLRYRLARYLVD